VKRQGIAPALRVNKGGQLEKVLFIFQQKRRSFGKLEGSKQKTLTRTRANRRAATKLV
jgi:hypothetical protein